MDSCRGRAQHMSIMIAGAANGIGKETAKLLAYEGARTLHLLDKDERALKELTDYLVQNYRTTEIRPTVIDLSDKSAPAKCQMSKDEPLHGVVVIAGKGTPGDVDPTDSTKVDWMVRYNLYPFVHVVQATIENLALTGGSLVSISSINSIIGAQPAYGATKAAIESLTLELAMRFARHRRGIRANCLRLGSIDTDRVWRSRKTEDPGGLNRYLKHIPMYRLGLPLEVARMILALIEPGYTTGAIIPVDGGASLPMPHLCDVPPEADNWWNYEKKS